MKHAIITITLKSGLQSFRFHKHMQDWQERFGKFISHTKRKKIYNNEILHNNTVLAYCFIRHRS
jgi:hypothetical protein